jgi:hypothetical protein
MNILLTLITCNFTFCQAIVSLDNVNQLLFVMEKCVFFEVWTESLKYLGKFRLQMVKILYIIIYVKI